MGNSCGRDENGEFHCVCGKCERIQEIEKRLDAIEQLTKPISVEVDLKTVVSQTVIDAFKKKEGD